MIYDSLKNIENYRCLGENFARVIDFLLANDLDALNEKRYDVDGSSYILPQQPTLQPAAERKWEAHRLYADIQIALTAGETIDAAPISDVGGWGEYNPEKDIVKSEADDPCAHLPMNAGYFAIFFPWDAHKPCCGEGTVKKLVAKVKL